MATTKKQVVKDPGFVEQLQQLGMSDRSISDMTFTPGDHQFLVKLMTTRDDAAKKELKEHVEEVFAKESRQMVKELADIVAYQNNKINRDHEELLGVIKTIATDISTIKADIKNINERLDIVEDKQETEEERIEKLEDWAKKVEAYVSVRWTLIRWGVAITIAVLSGMLIHSLLFS